MKGRGQYPSPVLGSTLKAPWEGEAMRVAAGPTSWKPRVEVISETSAKQPPLEMKRSPEMKRGVCVKFNVV